MEEKLKELMQELGNAINDSLSDSDRIAAAIGEIKKAGYDVFLVLEATIGFNKRSESDEDDRGDEETVELEQPPKKGGERSMERKRSGKLRLNSQDEKFLRALKISMGDDSNP